MAILVVLIPPRPRAGAAGTDAGGRGTAEFDYVLSPDGLNAGSEGRAKPEDLPRADTVVAVLADTDVAWHRLTLPKAPAARLRAALGGLLEEALLDDAEDTHLAVPPGATAGQPAWIAAVHRPWLAQHLRRLEEVGRPVERVVPSSWPDEVALGHFSELPGAGAGGTDRMMLVWSDAQGVACLALHGTLARALLPQQATQPARWTAEPAVAAQARARVDHGDLTALLYAQGYRAGDIVQTAAAAG